MEVIVCRSFVQRAKNAAQHHFTKNNNCQQIPSAITNVKTAKLAPTSSGRGSGCTAPASMMVHCMVFASRSSIVVFAFSESDHLAEGGGFKGHPDCRLNSKIAAFSIVTVSTTSISMATEIAQGTHQE